MKNYLLCCGKNGKHVIELLHNRLDVNEIITQLELEDVIVVEQRAGEEWFVFQERCKEICKDYCDPRQLVSFLDSNFFCSRQFDLENEYWILAFPPLEYCSHNCVACQDTEKEKLSRFTKNPPIFLKVYESEFPPMLYFVPDFNLTFEQIKGDWTFQRMSHYCCLECRHAIIS